MKVVVTGITGFICGHLAERLISEGHEVHAIVRKSSRIDELPENLQKNVKFHVYDEDNTVMTLMTNLCKDGKPDIVYHLASLYLVSHKYEEIENLIDSNVTFGTKLLDSMKANGIVNFVNTGTFVQHYKDADYSPVNLYSATKQCFEDILKLYIEVYKFKSISLHLFDTYGPNDKRRKIFNLFKEIGESGETLAMSPGEQLINMVYIDDVVDAFLLAGKYLVDGRYDLCGTYGVSSGSAVKLRELAAMFERVSGKKLSINWGGRPYREREVMVPWHSYKLLPGWKPKVNLEYGIEKFLNDKG